VQGGLLGGSFANQLGANGLPVARVVAYTNDWLTEFAPEPSGGSSAWTATGVVPRPASPVRANPFSAGSQGVLHGMLGVLDTGMGPYTRFVTETRLAGGGLDLASVPFQTSGLPTDASFRMAAVASHPLTGAVGHWILADSLTQADRYLLLYRPALSSPLVSQLRLAGWTPLGTATAPTPIPTPGGGFVLAGLTAQGSGAARLGALSGWNTWQSAASTSEQTLQLIAFPESSTGFVAAVTGMPLTPALDQFGTWECGSKGIRARSWSAQTLAPTGSPTLWSTLPCTEIHVRSEHSGDGVVSGTRHVVARVNGSLVYWRAAASTGASVSLFGWQQTVLAANLPASDAISVSPALLGEVAIATGDQLWVRDGGPWGAAPLLDPTWFDAAPSLPWQIAGGQQGEAPVLVGAALFPKLLGLGVERYWDSWLTWQPFNSIDDNCNGQ
jgi:hypothetical protein